MNPRRLYFLVHGVRPKRRAPRRWSPRKPARNFRYRAWIRSLPSAVSGAMGCEACHTGPHGLGQKSSDFRCIPLTHVEHMCLHAIGPAQFERIHGIDIEALVKRLNSLWFRYSREVK